MAIKRKHDSAPPTSTSGGSSQPKKLASHPLHPPHKVVQEPVEQEDLEEEEEEAEEVEEGDDEEEEEEDEEEEEAYSQETEPKPVSKNQSNRPKGKGASITYDHFEISTMQEDEDDADEPFSKNQLATLLLDAAVLHPTIADHLRRLANSDSAHRKILIHGLGCDITSDTLSNAFRQYARSRTAKLSSTRSTAVPRATASSSSRPGEAPAMPSGSPKRGLATA